MLEASRLLYLVCTVIVLCHNCLAHSLSKSWFISPPSSLPSVSQSTYQNTMNGNSNNYTIIVADIGGTNSRFQLFSVSSDDMKLVRGQKSPGTLLFQAKYKNEDYTSAGRPFVDVMKDFIMEANHTNKPLHVASIAVAGFVMNNTVSFTNNKHWSVKGGDLAQELGILGEVVLMNDFVANGYGLLTLNHSNEDDVLILQDVCPSYGAPMACLGAGTGLGECYVTSPRHREGREPDYTAYPSEGGHAEFSPRNPLECELLAYLMKKFEVKGRASVERVVSGPGLANIYEFLAQHPDYENDANKELTEQIKAAGKHGGAIVSQYAGKSSSALPSPSNQDLNNSDAAVVGKMGGGKEECHHKESDKLCCKAMDIFVSAYGSEAGVAALKFLPYGGLYLAGGVTVKNVQHILNRKLDTAYVPTPQKSMDNSDDAEATDAAAAAAGSSQAEGGAPRMTRFMKAFHEKGRLSPAINNIPLFVVMDQSLGQRGAHYAAIKFLLQYVEEMEDKNQ